MKPNGHPPNTVEWVNVSSADVVDWSQNVLPLGVEVQGSAGNALRLDADDLRILYLLLTKTLVVPNGDGTVTRIEPAVEGSHKLGTLAAWAHGARTWLLDREQRKK